MAWNAPITFTDGQVVDATDLNEQIRDNMLYLISANAVMRSTATGTLTTTSTTYASLGTAFALTLNTHGGHIMAGGQYFVSGAGGTNADQILLGIDIDGTTYPIAAQAAAQVGNTLRGERLFTGLASGAHIITLKQRVTVGTTTASTRPDILPLELWAVER